MRIKKSLFSFLFFSFLIVLSFGQSKSLRNAEYLLEKERYAEALMFFEECLLTDAKNYDLNYKAAKCASEIGDGLKALKYIDLAIQYCPKPLNQMYYVQARAFHLTHQFDKAIKSYIKSDPFNANKKDITKKINECENGKSFVSSSQKIKITNLGDKVNSDRHDFLPKITADTRIMYFTSQRSGGYGLENPEDVYQSLNINGAWSKPKNVGNPISTESNDACVGLSPDGHMMFLFNGINGGDLFISELKKGEWTKPKALPFNTEYKESSVTISPDGRTMFFVRKIEDGNSNIYQCRKNSSGAWSKPSRLTGVINSDYDEESPYLHPDGKTLYFSSKGHNSMGGYDVFKSIYENGQWNTPENLGFPINTANDELNFVLNAHGKLGYFSGIRDGGIGGLDLYSVEMPKAKESQLALLTGVILDDLTGKAIEAKISVTDNATNELIAEFYSDANSGEYLVSLPSGKDYGIRIEKENGFFYSENVSLDVKSKFNNVQRNVRLSDFSPGRSIVLNNVFFESGSFNLSKGSYTELDRIVDLLKSKDFKIEIRGHTDNIGDENLNKLLSERRAKTVVEYILSKGISQNKVVPKGYGSTKPIASNDTEEGRRKNRRTEFFIIE